MIIVNQEIEGKEGYKVSLKSSTDKNNLIAIKIPAILGGKTVTAIAESAFENCTNLESITIPEGITSIEEAAFRSCSALTNISLPESLTSIRKFAFRYCSELTTITIPNTVNAILGYAFESCSALTTITIPAGVTFLLNGTFMNCTNLSSITLEGATEIYPDCIPEQTKWVIEGSSDSIVKGEVESGKAIYTSPSESVTTIKKLPN